MEFLSNISKYVIIIFLGIFIAFFVAWIQYDSIDLSASVLSLTEQDFFESTQWEAWYKKENQNFEVFLADSVRNEWPLTISIIFSPENFERFTNQINTKYSVTNMTLNQENLTLNIDWYQHWDFTEWIFQIPYSWDSRNVTLEYIKSSNLDFAIWNLDNINSENQTH